MPRRRPGNELPSSAPSAASVPLEALAPPALRVLDLPEGPPHPASLVEALVEGRVLDGVLPRALEQDLAEVFLLLRVEFFGELRDGGRKGLAVVALPEHVDAVLEVAA